MNRALRWVLWSPVRAVTTGLVIVALVAVAGSVISYWNAVRDYEAELADFQAQQASGTVTSSATPGSSPTGDQSPSEVSGTTDPDAATDAGGASPQDEAAALAAAEAFVTAWLSAPEQPDDEAWIEAVEAEVASGLMPYVQSTPRDVVPTGDATDFTVTESGPFTATYEVTVTDAEPLRVTVTWNGQEWQTTDYGPA